MKNTTSVIKKNTTASKTVSVIARYFIKATFAIVYLIVNGSGKRYMVTMNANGTSGCEEIIPATDTKPETTQQCKACEHGHDCYHKLAVFAIEGARGLHVQEHGSIAGFCFTAPVEKKERTPRTYTFPVPTTVLEMNKLVALHGKTTSRAKLSALNTCFAGMIDESGIIEVEGARWYFDVDLKSIFEVVQVVPSMPALCPEEYQEAMHESAPDDVVSAVIPFEDDPFAAVPATVMVASHDHLEIGDRLPVQDGTLYEVIEEARPLTVGAGWQTKAKLVEQELPELPQVEARVTLDTEPLTPEETALFEQVDNAPIVLQDELSSEPKELTKAQVIMAIRSGVSTLVHLDPDYAGEDNGIGPNGLDTEFFHDLVRYERWTEKQIKTAAKKLQKYNKTQLGGSVPTMAVVEHVLGTPQAPRTLPQAKQYQNATLNAGGRDFSQVLLHR
jgi:hypothetical protein